MCSKKDKQALVEFFLYILQAAINQPYIKTYSHV